MRVGENLLSIVSFPLLRNRNFEACAPARIRFYCEFTVKQSDAFLDDHRAFALAIQFVQREPSSKREPAAIVFNYHIPGPIVSVKPHQYLLGAAVLADIDQAFLHNGSQFPANLRRHFEVVHIRLKLRGNTGFPLKSLHRIREKFHKLPGVHIQ